MSSTTFATMPQSVQNAISLLTSPLFLSPKFNRATIQALSDALCSSLQHLSSKPTFHLTLRLSASKLPPSVILAACFSVGVSWNKWALALTNGMHVDTVMEITPAFVSWTGAGVSPVVLRSAEVTMEMEIGDHKFAVVPPTPFLSQRPASPASSVSSGASSIFDSAASSPSSSLASSPASSPCHSRNSSLASTGSWLEAKGHKRTASKPIIDTSAVELQAFKYAGGETNVLGGGVMLGAGAAPAPTRPRVAAPAPVKVANKENAQKKQTRPRAASRAVNWRSTRV